MGFPGGLVVKNVRVMQETWVEFLGLEDPLEEEMATYSSILAWKIPWAEEPGRLWSVGSQRVRRDRATEHACMRLPWGSRGVEIAIGEEAGQQWSPARSLGCSCKRQGGRWASVYPAHL